MGIFMPNMVFFRQYLMCWKFMIGEIKLDIYWNTLEYDQ